MSALTAPVTIPEDRYFVLVSPEQPGNILLVGEDNQQGDRDRKSSV
jgi:hypothetical protein